MSLVYSQPSSGTYARTHQANLTAVKPQLSPQISFRAAKLTAPSSIDPLTLRHAKQPRFGCRLFGFISAQPDPKQGELLHELFYEGENSLKDQCDMRPEDDIFPRNWERLLANVYFPNGMYIDGQNDDGSGRARFDHNGKMDVYERSPEPFTKDGDIKTEVEGMRKKPPRAMILHLRDAASLMSTSSEAKMENSHPFRLMIKKNNKIVKQSNMAMTHNGTLPPNTVVWLEKQIARYHRKYPNDIPLPEGTSDSERAYIYMMGRLREKTGTVDTDRISTQQLEEVFKETLIRLDYLNNRPGNVMYIHHSSHFTDDTGLTVPKDSKMLLPYGMNFMLSDGKRVLVSRYNRSMHVATVTGDDGKAKAAFFSTYQMQPSQDSGLNKLKWWEIPERSMMTVEPGKDGNLNSKLQPFEADHNPFSPSFLWWRFKTSIQLLPVTFKMIRARFKGQNGYQVK